MTDITTIVPIIAITSVSMMFKETRWLSVVAIVPFLTSTLCFFLLVLSVSEQDISTGDIS